MSKQPFIDALGNKLPQLTALIIAGEIESINGKVHLTVRNMTYELQCYALGVTSLDHNEHCSALVTHDLNSFTCNDLGEVISNIRLGIGMF